MGCVMMLCEIRESELFLNGAAVAHPPNTAGLQGGASAEAVPRIE